MIQSLNKYIGVLILLVLLSGCAKDFESLNTDPNRPKEVNPGVMLGQLQYRFVTSSITAARNFTHELMQVDAPRASPGGVGLHRYVVNPGAGVWTNFYNYLIDVEDIYAISDKLNEPNYKAIALIYKAWSYSILTDLYGDVPFSEASKATEGKFQPAFDKQKDIYTKILADLETANTLINTTKALTYGGDIVYNANVLTGSVNQGMVKWKRFCNSLKLRLLLRISKRNDEMSINSQITSMLADPVKYPMFVTNADEAILRFTGSFPYFNPYYNARQLEWRDGTYFTKFFLDKMNTDNDPRRVLWSTTITVNGTPSYVGIESGYPASTEYQVGRNSSYNDVLRTFPQMGIMMTLAELEFIRAELALKGFNTGRTARQHYESGITASMAQWGVTMPVGFLNQSGIAYNATASNDQQLEKIMLQKYYAYFFVDYQSWFEKRRTGYPVLPRGTGIPAENKFPSRVPYPTYLQSLNAENLAKAVASMGGDNSDSKVWWEK